MIAYLTEQDFCCIEMFQAVVQDKVIYYEPIDRTYGILFSKIRMMPLKYCPACGKKLPRRLSTEYMEVLEKEYNIAVPDLTNFTNIPEECKTHEWWKKRGL